MLEVLKQSLQVVVVVAVLVMVFGLVARSNMRAGRIIGWFSIAWALAVAIVEGYGWYDKGDWIVMPAKQLWHQIDRSSLNEFESIMERYLSSSAAVGTDWLLQWPAWLCLSIIGLLFLVYDHMQLHRMHTGTPPTPLWKRLANLLRSVLRPDEEQEQS